MRAEDRKAGEISPALLRTYGESIYGERWQSPLARDLGVAQQTVAVWLVGGRPIPKARVIKILELTAAAAVKQFVAETARRCEAEGIMPSVLTFRPPSGPAGDVAIRFLKHIMPNIKITVAE